MRRFGEVGALQPDPRDSQREDQEPSERSSEALETSESKKPNVESL